MHAQFRTYRLNASGQQAAQSISQAFDELLTKLERLVPEGNQLGLCRNQLEQACFFAKKGMAMATGNQSDEQGKPEESAPPVSYDDLKNWAQKGSAYSDTLPQSPAPSAPESKDTSGDVATLPEQHLPEA